MRLSFIVLLLALSPLAVLYAGGDRNHMDSEEDRNEHSEKDEIVFLTGRIRIKGNEPHTSVVLVCENGDNFLLKGALAEELGKRYQLKSVSLKGMVLSGDKPFLPVELKVISFEAIK